MDLPTNWYLKKYLLLLVIWGITILRWKGIRLYFDLRLEEGWASIFFAYYPLGCPFFIQDTQHLGAKERTGFLKTACLGKFYPLGNCFATRVHLDELRKKVGKDKHGLRDCDVDLTDNMHIGWEAVQTKGHRSFGTTRSWYQRIFE